MLVPESCKEPSGCSGWTLELNGMLLDQRSRGNVDGSTHGYKLNMWISITAADEYEVMTPS